ncbi:GAF domain-containing protein [Enemella evansiae]|uniref:GAF domain-containing protein n=1 Tax=Enemella evansiae TaxID=2016499 RepID=UPI000B971DD9|nr:GAF domain-containing protein [Enemella evansiae]OYN98696.1 GAF domain-containing protein [Enemella evansiae]
MNGVESFTDLAAVQEEVRRELGFRLFTVLALEDEGRILTRVWSSEPEAYPVGGRKQVATEISPDWVQRCLVEQRSFFGATPEQVRQVFADHELITALGCGSIINVPVVVGGETVGALNILDAEGRYAADSVRPAERIAERSAYAIERSVG